MKRVHWAVVGAVATVGFGVAQAADPGLIIVAPEALAPGLAEFVEFKEARLSTRLVTLEAALEAGDRLGACADDAERLKRWLYREWAEARGAAEGGAGAGLGYVLLVGDADVLPVRYMVLDRNTQAAFNYAFYPSDLYYADLAAADGSFDDWNGQREGFHSAYFGEVRGEHNKGDAINFDGVDYRPEVGLGRWPVSTPEQVGIVAAKTMAYEAAVERGEVPARAALVMVEGWVDARGRMDRWGDALPGWEIVKRYDAFGGSASVTAPPREQEVLELINGTDGGGAAGGVGLIVHAGHGSDDSWHASLGVRSIGRMTNVGVTPVMLSAGCSTARFATLPPYEAYEDAQGATHVGTDAGEVFDAPPPPPSCYARGAFNKAGFGERLLRDGPTGAVAYIGCNTGSQPCGLTLVEGFVRALGDGVNAGGRGGRVRLGDCWKAAVAYYYEAEGLSTIEPTESWYPASIFFQGMKFMLFGDPSIPMAGG